MKLIEIGCDVTDGINEHQQRNAVADELRGSEAAGMDPPGPQQQNCQDPCGFKKAHHRMLQRHQIQGAEAGPAMSINLAGKALLEPLLRCKRPHQVQATNGFRHQRRQRTDLCLAALRSPQHLAAKPAHQHNHDGGQQQGGPRKQTIQPGYVAQYRHQQQDAGGAVVDGFVDHLPDAVRIFREAIGQITTGQLFQRGEGQPLQARKDGLTQGLAHLQGWTGQQAVLTVLGQLLGQENGHGHCDDGQCVLEAPTTNGWNQVASHLGKEGERAHIDHGAAGPRQQRDPMPSQ